MRHNNDESRIAICGGRILDPSNGLDNDLNIFIERGIVSNISSQSPKRRDDVINASGMYVVSGFIDIHVHLREPGFEYKEDIVSGSRAAAMGGFTSIACMPNTSPVNDDALITRYIMEKSKSAGLVDIFPIGAMTKKLKGISPADYQKMMTEGIVGISDDGNCIQNDEIALDIFKQASGLGLTIFSHSEDVSISGKGIVNNGFASRHLGLAGIPARAEERMIERDLNLSAKTGAKLHICHVSTKKGLGLIREAKRSGIKVTCEATPHHLLLTENDVSSIGANAVMKPPLRTNDDRLALIGGLIDGTIDAIATDHAPHAPDEKKSIADAAFGVIGMETAFSTTMKLVHDGILSFERLVELFTSGPAGVLGMKNHGSLNIGSSADITILDIDSEYDINPDSFESKSRNTPFANWHVKGRVIRTIKFGKTIYAAAN